MFVFIHVHPRIRLKGNFLKSIASSNSLGQVGLNVVRLIQIRK